MNLYFLIAGCLAIALGIIHSILGEILIFRHLRKSDIFSDKGMSKLKIRHYKTMWSTWHLVTLFGWGIGAILIVQSWQGPANITLSNISTVINILFLISTIYWLVATKGKHPAWIILGTISFLVWLANNA